MSTDLSLPLRILYTINGSPQYILARSSGFVSVTTISPPCAKASDSAQRHPYGTVTLKICLETICRSSPELIQDNTRDYSAYVLDPLESFLVPPAVSAEPHSRNHPRGVAVGLGLMSRALASEDSKSLPVVGTIIQLGTGQDALEVLFALRETPFIRDTSVYTPSLPPNNAWAVSKIPDVNHALPYSSSALEPPGSKERLLPIPAATARAKPKAPPALVVKQQSQGRLLTDAERLLQLAPKLPCTSVKKSRRSIPESHRNKPLFVQAPLAMPKLPSTASASSQENSDTTNISRAPSVSTLSAPTGCTETQNAAFLAALSAIDASNAGATSQGTSGSTSVSSALVQALKQLLTAACAAPVPKPVEPEVHPVPTKKLSSSPAKSQEDDIILLDKENVNPSAFRRRAEREREDAKLHFLTSPDNASRISSGPPGAPRVGLGAAADVGNRARHSNIMHTPPPPSRTPSGSDTASSPPRRKKRRLSEVMDEKESDSQRASRRDSHRHRRSSERHRLSGENNSPGRHYARLAHSDSFFHSAAYFSGPSTSPLRNERHYERQFWDNQHSGPMQLPQNSGPPVSPKRLGVGLSASSPARPVEGTVRSLRKPYKVPDWAKTNTPWRPRLSKEAEHALTEKEKVDAAKRELKKDKKRERRRKRDIDRHYNEDTKSSDAGFDGSKQSLARSAHTSQVCSTSATAPLPIPVLASQECPIFSDPVAPTDYESRSSSPCRNPLPSPKELPRTPPRRPGNGLPATPMGSSLFTPTPKGLSRNHPGALFSPFGAPGSPIPKSTIWSALVPSHAEEQLLSPTGLFVKELDDVMQQPESDQHSLPIASSDTDFDESVRVRSNDESIEEDDEVSSPVRMQWDGLPPSSPPPPSSPLPEPEPELSEPVIQKLDDEDETIRLPEASQVEDIFTPSEDDVTFSPEDLAAYFQVNDFDGLFKSNSAAPHPDSQPSSIAELDVLSQFAYHLAQSEELTAHNDLSAVALLDEPSQNCLADLDFSQFWSNVKPLVESSTHNMAAESKEPPIGMGFDFGLLENTERDRANGEVDHEKLAEEVHSLFSGCLM